MAGKTTEAKPVTVEERLAAIEEKLNSVDTGTGEHTEKLEIKCTCSGNCSNEDSEPWYQSDWFIAGATVAGIAAVGYIAYKAFFSNDEGGDVTINLGD